MREPTRMPALRRLNELARFLRYPLVSGVILWNSIGQVNRRREGRGGLVSFIPVHNASGTLQSTLSSATAQSSDASPTPHHPITCASELAVDLDRRTFDCVHAQVNIDTDSRTKAILNHTMVLLVLEPALSGNWEYKTPDKLIEDWNKAHPEEPWN